MPRQFVVHSQRERMLDATSEAVSQLGYPALTVAAILERAGVSRKTFYEHFADKEECFLASYDAIVEQLAAAVSVAYNAEGPWRDRVHAGLSAFLDFLAAEPAFARMCIVEVLAAGPGALQRRDGAMRMFTMFFEAGRQEAPPDMHLPRITSEAVVGAIYEIVYARVLRDATHELPGLLPDLMYISLVPYLGREEAGRSEIKPEPLGRAKAKTKTTRAGAKGKLAAVKSKPAAAKAKPAGQRKPATS